MKFIVTVFKQDYVEIIANYFKGEIVSLKEGLIIVSAKSLFDLDKEIKDKFPDTDFNSTYQKIKPYTSLHGGKRDNSGAKQKYGEPTKTVTFRIPISKIKDVKKIVADYLKSLIECSKPY